MGPRTRTGELTGQTAACPGDETPYARLLTILRGGGEWPAENGPEWQELRQTAEHHRVLPLMAEAAQTQANVAADIVLDLQADMRRAVIGEAVREAELVDLLQGLHEARVGALLFKGAALAYTCYARPELRPRTDTDVLVGEASRPMADRVLRSLGYEDVGHFSGDLVSYQAAYVKRRGGVRVHVVDLHWRVANPQAFGDVLPYDEALAAAVPVAPLGSGARTLSPVHALLVACVHRVAHHGGDERLIWLVDIGRLAGKLGNEDWTMFVGLARARQVVRVCRSSLAEAVEGCGARVPETVMTALADATDGREASAAFLNRRRHAAVVTQDLLTLPTWRSRVRLLRQHAFPSVSYMRDTYAPGSRLPLFMLYAMRALRGARKWLAHA